MIPDTVIDGRRVVLARNYGGFLLGVTWAHDKSWSPRLTHFYLGWWTLTLRTDMHGFDGEKMEP